MNKNLILALNALSLALPLPACNRTGPGEGELEINLSIHDDIPTMVLVSWETDQPGESWVEYGNSGVLDLTTPVYEPSTQHEFALLGLGPLEDIQLMACTDSGDDILTGWGEISTNNMPSTLPNLQVTTYHQDLADPQPYLLGSVVGEYNVLYIMDRNGEWSWYADQEDDTFTIHTAPLSDGGGMLHNIFPWPMMASEVKLRSTTLDGRWQEQWDTPGAHHGFAQLPDGNIALIVSDVRDWLSTETGEVEQVGGDAIVEMAPDGSTTEVFSTWDALEPFIHENWDMDYLTTGVRDWTHANAIYYYEGTDTYLFSLGNIDTILEIDRSDGQVLRSFGFDAEYSFAPGSPAFDFQHDPQWTDQGTLLMNSLHEHVRNIAIEYRVDDTNHLLEEIWSYGKSEDIYAFAMGQVSRLSNGNTLVGFGTAGILREITPKGQVAWELLGGAGTWFGQQVLLEDLYQLN